MQHILSILERRSRDTYYEDCPKGTVLNHIYTDSGQSLHDELRAADEPLLIQLVEGYLQELPFQPPWSQQERYTVEDALHSAMLKHMVWERADHFGCHAHKCCILCPEGRKLVAREFYDYMAGVRGGNR
jgi:hypothetical protein